MSEYKFTCPFCGSDDLIARGWVDVRTEKFTSYDIDECWCRGCKTDIVEPHHTIATEEDEG